jgi:hypothetical protein
LKTATTMTRTTKMREVKVLALKVAVKKMKKQEGVVVGGRTSLG